jgi:hypothetical protein
MQRGLIINWTTEDRRQRTEEGKADIVICPPSSVVCRPS